YTTAAFLCSMDDTSESKYVVPVKQVEKSLKLTDQAKAELHSVGMMDDKGKLKLKGVSPKMLKRMKLEAVDCPVLEKEVGFIQCYVCKNFHSRITGQVYCKGEPF
ncbi:MAG: hypothetical protein WAL66_07320, partial [Nitrososphaeraceae archaeon]